MAGDQKIPENSKDNLERRLDHGIKETFPTSDPVSVSITKGGAIDYENDADAALKATRQTQAENIVEQAQEVLSGAAEVASDAARQAYDQGAKYARAAREQYPEAERYYRAGMDAARAQASEMPLATLLVGVGLGYVLGWMIHGTGQPNRQGVPDYARTDRAFSNRR